MHITKRNGNLQDFDVTKIEKCVSSMCWGLNDYVKANFFDLVVQPTIKGLYNSVKTEEILNLLSENASNRTISHPDYGILAGRFTVLNLNKKTTPNLKEYATTLREYINPSTGKQGPLLTEQAYKVFCEYEKRLTYEINYNRDFNFTSFGINTLLKSYLIKINKKVYERPQQLYMRVAIGIHGFDIESVVKTYHYLSMGLYTHATPTMFHSGTPGGQLGSCFLVRCKDSIESIFETIKKSAIISKNAGGIGLYLSDVRAKGSYIAGTNGESNGVVPLMETLNKVARYVDQGGNKRPGAIAVYFEPWHGDIISVLRSIRPAVTSEQNLTIDLFLGLMIPDLFMKRVSEDGIWSLMCPNECTGLTDCYGEAFEKLYKHYESEKKFKKQIKARELWEEMLSCQLETGRPYFLYKDACNEKSNQKNLGTIKCSNLCTEILQYSSPNEEAVCNLASIALPKCVNKNKTYNFHLLHEITKLVTRNLNRVIDVTTYPIEGARQSNLKHRPIGIGVQGLADTFAMMRLPFESLEAQKLNILIFETIYHGALEASMELAKLYGPYSSYEGSPVSQGILQYDMWNVTPTDLWDWDSLKTNIKTFGVRNSLLTALMPTASTARILGNVEAFQPFEYNVYTRKTKSGSYQCINSYLIKDLMDLNLWNDDMKKEIMASNGSIQNIDKIPSDIKALYKTSREMSNKTLIQMVADRGAFVDQSQSFSPKLSDPLKLSSIHFESWKKGNKTGSYYIEISSATTAIKVTACTRNGDCISCSS